MQVESLRTQQKHFQRIDNFRRFWVFVLSYRASSKRRKGRKIQKTLFQWQINEWELFSWVKQIAWMKNLQKVPSQQRFLYQETMNVTWSKNFGKVVVFGLCRIQILKVTYMSYMDQVFESLTNKIQSFQIFQNFRRFQVFVLSYKLQSQNEKTETTENLENHISVAN